MTSSRADDVKPAPARMRVTDLHPDLRSAYRWFPRPQVRHAWQRRMAQAALALIPPPKPAEGVRFERVDFGVPGTGVRVFKPTVALAPGSAAPASAGPDSGARGALLWIHGGGLVIGAAAQDDGWCARLAERLGIVVVSVKYRLAPEHPFPAPLDDCVSAWRWLQDAAAARGIDPARVAVGGQSAGGGLAAALAQRLLDEGATQPAAQLLYCPMLDDRTAARRELDAARHFAWTNRDNLVGWSSYLQSAPGADVVPDYAVPARRADLSGRSELTGLPPTWIGVGDIDLFHDEDLAYAAALRDAGVDCTVDVVPGAPHGFESIARAADVTHAFHARARAWLGERLANGSPS
ncbi:alpha/beta hydrolase [Agromyces bracchium]|uniref:Alpha/beta hydrolase fold domain-containing protein n=1 Tax=Agromyces bracchium TaxID=88376 RepID=A0A6I3M219_9MICO|nr:alpha/beta hydrolase [Agromyces bracchium]MTH67374.1 alpha/beta hydrolase fold domain-containing protein [Agromyces bracchium]